MRMGVSTAVPTTSPVAAVGAGWEGHQHLVGIGGDTHDAGERLQWNAHPLDEVDEVGLLVELVGLEDPRRGLVGEEAEVRPHAGPAPVPRLELEQLDRENVARLGTLDVDRPGERVHTIHVHALEVVHGRVDVQLPAGSLVGVGLDHGAARYTDGRRDDAAELVVCLIRADDEVRLGKVAARGGRLAAGTADHRPGQCQDKSVSHQ
jgi:hypothetical protein